MNLKNIDSYKEEEREEELHGLEAKARIQRKRIRRMSRKKGFNEELMRMGILEDEVRASSAAPRTLSGPLKWREKRTISVAAHNNQRCGSKDRGAFILPDGR